MVLTRGRVHLNFVGTNFFMLFGPKHVFMPFSVVTKRYYAWITEKFDQ